MINAKNLSKKYKKKFAVNDLSFDVSTGKVTGFLGPNGAGKSTTMRLMLGLDNGGGSTMFDGKPLHEYPEPSKMVGVLLEAKAFHPTRSARNHLRILAAAGGIADKRVEEVLELVGLQTVAKEKPGKFSLGMSQRLGIAAAILGNPKYLVLDEPANGLDPEGIAWLRRFLKDYADHGNAVFVSSHLLSEMAQMADNIVVIGKGKLIASTTVAKLISNGGHTKVFIRVDGSKKLEKRLKKDKVDFEMVNNGLMVSGLTTEELGLLAHDTKTAVLELATHTASLEEVFLEMTAGEEEYKGIPEVKKP
jgi:ABC-2 type transport system ATP-binding protein